MGCAAAEAPRRLRMAAERQLVEVEQLHSAWGPRSAAGSSFEERSGVVVEALEAVGGRPGLCRPHTRRVGKRPLKP